MEYEAQDLQVMKERDDSKPLSGIIQLDDVYWGGERHGGKRGRGSKNKVPFVAAVSLNEEGHPIAMNMKGSKGFDSLKYHVGQSNIYNQRARLFLMVYLALQR